MKLLSVLPFLAVASMAVEPVAAHGSRLRERHGHLARRAVHKPVARSAVGAQERPRVIRRADGTQCRVRPAAQKAPADNGPEVNAPAGNQPANSEAPPTQSTADAPAQQPTDVSTDAPWQPSPPVDSAPPQPTETQTQEHIPPPQENTGAPPPVVQPPATNWGMTNAGSKGGLAWPNNDWAVNHNWVGTKVSWFYTWNSYGSAAFQAFQSGGWNIEYVPMLARPWQVDEWYANKDSWPATTKDALFFNEPEEPGQANIGAAEAVNAWLHVFTPVAREKGYRRGAAATTNSPKGVQWTKDFLAACKNQGGSDSDCNPDFLPVHFYGMGANNFINFLQTYHSQMPGHPMWVTEFACQNFDDATKGYIQCTPDEIWAFARETSAFMDSQDWIERYSPFGAVNPTAYINNQGHDENLGADFNFNNILMTKEGVPTDLGRFWLYEA